MKKTIAILSVFILIMCGLSFSAFADLPISIYVDGEKLECDVAPFIEEGRTLVPVRAIFEALGASVEWDDAERMVTAEFGATSISLNIDSTSMMKNLSVFHIDVPARIVNDRTFVPLRAVSEAFDCDVAWDDATRTVTVVSRDYPVEFTYMNNETVKETGIDGVTVSLTHIYPEITSGNGFLSDEAVAYFNDVARIADFAMFSFDEYADTFAEEWGGIANELYGYPNVRVEIKTLISFSEKYKTVSFNTYYSIPYLGVYVQTHTYDKDTLAEYMTIADALKVTTEEEKNTLYNDIYAKFASADSDVQYGRQLFDAPVEYGLGFTLSEDKLSVYISRKELIGVGRVEGFYGLIWPC